MAMGDAYVIVYSVTDKGSFEKASELRVQLRRARQTDDVPIILVGNKSDLVRSREVSLDGKQGVESESQGNPGWAEVLQSWLSSSPWGPSVAKSAQEENLVGGEGESYCPPTGRPKTGECWGKEQMH